MWSAQVSYEFRCDLFTLCDECELYINKHTYNKRNNKNNNIYEQQQQCYEHNRLQQIRVMMR